MCLVCFGAIIEKKTRSFLKTLVQYLNLYCNVFLEQSAKAKEKKLCKECVLFVFFHISFIPDKQQLKLHHKICSQLDTACPDLITKFLEAIISCCLFTLSTTNATETNSTHLLSSTKCNNLSLVENENFEKKIH